MFFFFQAEDGIRDLTVTGVQTCALPISAFKLTADGEWARLIRIDFSLLLTELIRTQAFHAVTPATLAGLMACIAYDNDRPASFPRITAAPANLVATARPMAEALAPHDEPPPLRP